MKKALMLLLLSFVLLVAAFSLSSCGILLKKTGFYDGYEYHVDSEYEITITGYKGEATKLEIPSWLDGYKVVGLKFDEKDTTLEKIESIKIPKTVTSISDKTFDPCKNLKEIVVSIDNPEYKYFHDALYTKDGKTLLCYPQGKEKAEIEINKRVTDISDRAFFGARYIKSITFTGTQRIGNSAFLGCTALETVDFGPDIKEIGDSAFEGCQLITSIVIPDTVERIGEAAFKNCSALTSISVGNGVCYVGSEAFGDLDALTTKTEYRGAYYLGNATNPYAVLVKVDSKIETEYILHPEINVIYGSVFEECESLENIALPNSLTYIGKRAFYNCKKLKNIYVPEYVNSIEEYSFYGCSSITEIVLPSSVTAVGYASFAECASLSSVTFSERAESIGQMAFAECSALTKIELPESMRYIGNYAFSDCTSLAEINIPSGIEFIGNKVFEGCDLLRMNEHLGVYYLGNTENPYLVLLRAKNNEIELCDVNENTKFICESAFYGSTALLAVNIPEGVISIGPSAFENCTVLEDIAIPASVGYIGEKAFAGCTNLANVIFVDALNWTTDESVIAQSSLSNLSSAAQLLKSQDKAMTKLIVDDYVEEPDLGADENSPQEQ